MVLPIAAVAMVHPGEDTAVLQVPATVMVVMAAVPGVVTAMIVIVVMAMAVLAPGMEMVPVVAPPEGAAVTHNVVLDHMAEATEAVIGEMRKNDLKGP